MSIVIIEGDKSTGKTLIANALRNNQIASGKGALLVDDDQEGEAKALLEKIIIAEPFPAGEELSQTKLKSLPWKKDAMIIVVEGGKRNVLDEFEDLFPGFEDFFGPVFTITTRKEAKSSKKE